MLAETRMSRARLFVVIDAFENDMRAVVEKYLLDHLEEEVALGPDFPTAELYRSNDAGEESVSIVHYLYLRQCYDILNRNRSVLPGDLAAEVRANTPGLDTIVPIRNRVMHGRPLRPEDPESAISALAGFTGRYWQQTRDTLIRLANDPAWEPAFETLDSPSERVLHNLPPADYDETGLIGRSDDVRKLVELVKRRRESIVTITGEGGIGKTALALDVAYSLVDDVTAPFDCVLWVSLKREMLTAYGVREISTALKDLTEATGSLGRVLDTSFLGSVRELTDMLQGINALIVIDNLESAQGAEVISLYDSLPNSVSYLFTSRLGIGEIERRYPLGPLSDSHAIQLFRKFAARRGQVRLAGLSQLTLKDVVIENLRSSPLAIRWYILSVESGEEPVSTLRNQEELLNFCVRNVYDALSSQTREVLSVLHLLDHSVSFSELAVLTEQSIDELRRAIQEMSRGSLVVHDADPAGGIASRLSVSATARMFLPRQTDGQLSSTELMRREQDYLRAVERRRAEQANRLLGPNVVRVRGAEDEPAAHLLRIALSFSKKGDISRSQEYVERARALNPDFWECDRVDAFIASNQQQRERAASLYRSALAKADSPESRAVVCHFFSGHLARAMLEPELALPYAKEAHELFRNSDTALAYGNLLVWNGKFAEGQELLEVAADEATGKTKMIALTGVVDSWRRWGEELLSSRQPLESFEKSAAGFNIGSDAISRGFYDVRLGTATIEAIMSALKAAVKPGVKTRSVESRLRKMFQALAKEVTLYAGTRTWPRFQTSLAKWVQTSQPVDDTRILANFLLGQEVREQDAAERKTRLGRTEAANTSDGKMIGEIVSWTGRYGFIKHPDYPGNVFFHRGSFTNPDSVLGRPLHGATTYFSVESDETGRVKAAGMSLIDAPDEP